MRPVQRFLRRVGASAGGQTKSGDGPREQRRTCIVERRALTEDNIDAVDINRVRVVLVMRQWPRFGRRLRVRFWSVVAIVMVVLVTAGLVVLMTMTRVTRWSRGRVEMRTEVVSARRPVAVRMRKYSR